MGRKRFWPSCRPVTDCRYRCPIVIAQHMPADFTRPLAERLARLTSLTVREATPDALLETGDVWIARGGLHLAVVREHRHHRLRLLATPPENSCRPSADVLFRSVVGDVSGPAFWASS